MPNLMTTQEESCSLWQLIPDSVLLQVFSHLPTRILLNASQVCKVWHRVAMDEYLWKDLLHRAWRIDPHIAMAPGKVSWLQEFKRLYYHTPQIESEVLCDHRDQVLHISFSHDGQMFATSSKDGYIKVWSASYPSHVKYYADMRDFTWKYTQFSQFNETDTLLLVSGVHFGAHSTSGEIAIFNLVNGFELQSRVLNKPYDIFGTWYNETYLLSGNLHWLGHLGSCSVLWLNKASQALESETESVVMRLYKFRNINASSIRTVMIAKCNDEEPPNKLSTDASGSGTAASSTAFKDEYSSPLDFDESLDQGVPMDDDWPLLLLDELAEVAGGPEPAASCSGVNIMMDLKPPAPPDRPDISMKGAGTSHSECTQGKMKCTDRKVKAWHNNAHTSTDECTEGIRLPNVIDSKDGKETIEYSMDYRRAEERHLMGLSSESLILQPNASAYGVEAMEDCQDFPVSGHGDGLPLPYAPRSTLLSHSTKTETAAKLVALEPSYIPSTSSSNSTDQTPGPLWETNSESNSNIRICSSRYNDSNRQNMISISSTIPTESGLKSNNPGVSKYVATCPGGDINVNTNSTGNNNSNKFSLRPDVPLPSTAAAVPIMNCAGDAPMLPSESQPEPIGATCSASAPQPLPSTSAGCRMSELNFTGTGDRYLIFTTGMKTYTPHQIGIKRIKSLQQGHSSDPKSQSGARLQSNVLDTEIWRDEFDTVDHLIELHGHIIGMCLSTDNRYLYVNSRPWPQGYEIDDPLYPPPIAQEIDIHVIDLKTMREVGTMLRAHKAYTPNDECFFIFLDVCQEYVASGAEDKHGYLWDRHYGVCLTKFPHADVVNSVAFNPQDPETLITASDDNSLKIWRSRNREIQVKGELSKSKVTKL